MTQIQIPTAITAPVTPLQGASVCMDGATHLMQSPMGTFRLKAGSDAVLQALKSVEDGNQKVTVMAYPAPGPEGAHLAVYEVMVLHEAMRAFGPGTDPWPWNSLIRK